MKIFVPVFDPRLAGKTIGKNGNNPGIGGTTFTAIQMAIFLAESSPIHEIYLPSNNSFKIPLAPPNLRVVNSPSFEQLFKDEIDTSEKPIVISPAAYLNNISSEALSEYSTFIVPWIRHPFYFSMVLYKHNFPAYVCVGSYQYRSNRFYYKPLAHIQNIFRLPDEKPKFPSHKYGAPTSPLNLVFLGALTKPKGFHIIAESWNRIATDFPGAILHVIGSGSEKANGSPDHEFLPAGKKYGELILKHIPLNDINAGKVIFHGNLGEEKNAIIRNCHAALLNPTGTSEAFPASPLQCMALGVPVIASDRLGMSDCMRYFPELALHHTNEIPEKIIYLLRDPLQYKDFQLRAFNTAKWFASQTDSIILRWQFLVSAYSTNKVKRTSDLVPTLPPYGSKVFLVYMCLTRLLYGFLEKHINERIMTILRRADGRLFGVRPSPHVQRNANADNDSGPKQNQKAKRE